MASVLFCKTDIYTVVLTSSLALARACRAGSKMQGCAARAAQGMGERNNDTLACAFAARRPPDTAAAPDLLQEAGVGHDVRVALLQRRQVRDDRVRERGLELAPAHAADLHQRRLLHNPKEARHNTPYPA